MSTMAKTYRTLVFKIQALTNLHAGSGDSFYGAVDKLVQRDAATRRPTIHSHSLKGALREYFESELGFVKGTKDQKDFVTHVFGSAVSGDANDAKPGNFRFFSADLLALPVPDENPTSNVAFHSSSEAVWTHFAQKTQLLNGTGWTADKLKTAFAGGNTFTMDAQKFKEATEELPVVARNQLNNGESQNLWYEELVPHESVFGFLMQADDTLQEAEFTGKLDGKVVQIGANASVGYGYCLITLLNPTVKS